MSYFREQENDWLKTIEVKADSVLDVGAGEEKYWAKNRVKSWDVMDYVRLDWERSTKPNVMFNINYFQHAEDVFKGKRFDTIFCLNVFEYVWNPVYAIHNLWDWLKPGGTLYASFPFVYPQHEPAGLDYMRYTGEGVERLLIEPFGRGFSEFTVIPKVATKGRDLLLNFYTQEGMHPSRNKEHDIIGWHVKARK